MLVVNFCVSFTLRLQSGKFILLLVFLLNRESVKAKLINEAAEAGSVVFWFDDDCIVDISQLLAFNMLEGGQGVGLRRI